MGAVPNAHATDAGTFTASEAQKYFARAIRPSQSQLIGDWLLVGRAASSGPVGYDSNGLKFEDDSESTLQFAKSTTFEGDPVLLAGMIGFGAQDAVYGPFAVKPTAQQISFQVSHFDQHCRVVKKDSNRLICELINEGRVVEYHGYEKKN